MAQPDGLPYWATDDENDPTFGTPNKAIPSSTKQSYGQRVGINTLRQDINYLFNKIREWIQFLDERYAVGDIYITADSGATATSIGIQLGGTWVAQGSDTLASTTVYIFEKTS